MILRKLAALQGEQQYNQAEKMRDYYSRVRSQNPHLSADAAWYQTANTALNRTRNGMGNKEMQMFYNRYVAGDPQQNSYNAKTRSMDPMQYDKWSRANPIKSNIASFTSGLASGATFGLVGSKQIAGYDDTVPTYDTMSNRVNASSNAIGNLIGGTAAFATAMTGINRLRRGKAIGKMLGKVMNNKAATKVMMGGKLVDRATRRAAAANRVSNRFNNMSFGKEALRTTKRWLVDPAKEAWRAVRHPVRTFTKKYNKYGPGVWNRTKGITSGVASLALPTFFASEYINPVTNLATGSLVNKVDSPENMQQQY